MITASYLVQELNQNIQDLPNGFYDTFDYTRDRNNLTHPVTLGILTTIILKDDSIFKLAIDLRLNKGNKIKFQPDIVALNKDLKPLIFFDYESPNSCDCRIPTKDVESYLSWSENDKEIIPYFIITTLPDCESPKWELRYKKKHNSIFKNRKDDICKNPFNFWYSHYKNALASKNISRISFINISKKIVKEISINNV